MNTKQLEVLLEIVSCQSINKAARNLYMTPQAVSSSIISLENELGFQILNRSRHGVRLTGNGELILDQAKTMLESYRDWRSIGGRETGPAGEVLTIAASPVACGMCIEAMSALVSAEPMVSLRFLKATRGLMREHVLERRIDIGIYAVQNEAAQFEFSEFLRSSGYRMEKLFEEEYLVFVNAQSDHVQGKSSFSLEDLRDFSLINYHERTNSFMYPQIVEYVNHDRLFSFNDNQNILEFISRNKNICAFYPRLQMRTLPPQVAQRLVAYPIDGLHMPTTSFLIYPAESRTGAAARRFIGILKQTAQDYAGG